MHTAVFGISMFVYPKMAPAGAETTCEKYSTFFNSFNADAKEIIQGLEWISDKISRSKVSVLTNHTHTHTHTHSLSLSLSLSLSHTHTHKTHTHIYIYLEGERDAEREREREREKREAKPNQTNCR